MRKTFSTSLPRRKPVKRTLCPMPMLAAISMVRRVMSPEPAMTNLTLSITSSTFLAAARKYSGPFCMVMRPRNRTIFSSLWILYFSSSKPLPLD